MKVLEANQYVVNRWKKKEQAAGTNKKVSHATIEDEIYVNVTCSGKDAFLGYTEAM